MVAIYSTAVREHGFLNGRPIGVLGVVFNWENLANAILNSSVFDEATWRMFVDGSGNVLAASSNVPKNFRFPVQRYEKVFQDADWFRGRSIRRKGRLYRTCTFTRIRNLFHRMAFHPYSTTSLAMSLLSSVWQGTFVASHDTRGSLSMRCLELFLGLEVTQHPSPKLRLLELSTSMRLLLVFIRQIFSILLSREKSRLCHGSGSRHMMQMHGG